MQRQVLMGIMVFMLVISAFGCAELMHGDRKGHEVGNVEVPPDIAGSSSTTLVESLNGDTKAKERAVVTLRAVGQGIAPENATSRGQAIILGECAARANGYVKLAEKIYGVYIESYRQIGRGVVDVEMVRQETQALLKGAEVLEYRQIDNGIFEAYMQVKIVVNQNSPLYPLGS
jgi:hypothetical protein